MKVIVTALVMLVMGESEKIVHCQYQYMGDLVGREASVNSIRIVCLLWFTVRNSFQNWKLILMSGSLYSDVYPDSLPIIILNYAICMMLNFGQKELNPP